MEEYESSGKRQGASGYVHCLQRAQVPAPMARISSYFPFSMRIMDMKLAACFLEVSSMVSKSKSSSILPTVCTSMPKEYFLARSVASSMLPHAGGQRQLRP